jgi:hypothetical protein
MNESKLKRKAKKLYSFSLKANKVWLTAKSRDHTLIPSSIPIIVPNQTELMPAGQRILYDTLLLYITVYGQTAPHSQYKIREGSKSVSSLILSNDKEESVRTRLKIGKKSSPFYIQPFFSDSHYYIIWGRVEVGRPFIPVKQITTNVTRLYSYNIHISSSRLFPSPHTMEIN